MTKTYQFQVNQTLTQKKRWLNWLPTIAWLPFVLVIGSIVIPPVIKAGYWGRWIGLIILLIYGFFNLFIPGKWRLNRFDNFAFIILLIITISTVYADIDGALYATDFYETGVFKAFSILVTYLSLTWGLQSLLNSFDNAITIIKNLVITATIIYTVGLVGNLSGLIPPSLGAYSGIFFNPNTTAALGVVVLPLSIWLSFQQKHWGILRFFPIFIIFIPIILSGARTALFATGMLIIYNLICRSRYKGWGIMSVYTSFAIVTSILLILSIDFWESPQFAKLYEGVTTSRSAGITSFRFNLLWPLFIKEIFSSPFAALFGHGWGSEEAFLKFQGMQNDFFQRWSLGTAHSAYVGLTYQIGIIGSLLTFVPLWSLVVSYIHKSSLATSKPEFEFRLALHSALLAELCVCFFETGFYNIGATHAFLGWLVVYILVKLDDLLLKQAR
jgi:hypothetical protein